MDAIYVIAAGGGGSGNAGGNQPAGGGGGECRFLGPTTVTFPVPYSIGTAGTGGPNGSPGTAGGNTWAISNTTLLAKGGMGGNGSTSGKGGGQTGNTGGIGGTSHPGGNGGTPANNGSGGTGGGGAGGPNGAGAAGGAYSISDTNGGGTGGGGADGGTAGTAKTAGSNGTNGGNGFGGTGAGTGATSAVTGGTGTSGGGGGGGFGGTSTAVSAGGPGGMESAWTDTASGLPYGPGGGGGGGGGNGTHSGSGGAGGGYGGGGGGAGYNQSTTTGGTGPGGLVVFVYTPVAGPHLKEPTPRGYNYSSSAVIGCSTDTTSGTLYVVVDTVANITGITVAQVKAGENNTGSAAAFSGNSTVSHQRPSKTIAGLTVGSTYGYAIVQNATSGDSLVLASSFTVGSAQSSRALVYQHVGGGGNPQFAALAGNAFQCPWIKPSGPGNCYVMAITYTGGSSVSSITSAVNGSLGAAAVTALGGSGNLDSAIFVLPNIAGITFSGTLSSGATSATLASAWTGSTAGLVVQFSNGDYRTVSFTNGSPSVSWTTGISSGVSANARARDVITVSFSANVDCFQYCMTEYYGVATASVVNGSQSAAYSATLGTGTFTPGDNDANGGNIIWAYFAKADQGPAHITTSIAAGSGFTLLNADVGWNSANYSMTKAVQALAQTSAAALNPTITPSDSGDHWNSLAVALKVSASSGTAPDSGIQIEKIDHFSTENFPASGTWTTQFPTVGNLRAISCPDNNLHITGVTDSEGNTWTQDTANAQFWYLPDATPNPNLTVYVAGGGGDSHTSWRAHDITCADVSPYLGGVASAIGSTGTTFTLSPAPSPPIVPALCIANIEMGIGPGLSVTSPSGAFWDLCIYPPLEVDADDIDNADIGAHWFATATGSETVTFTCHQNTSTNAGVVYFLKSTTSPILTSPTPSGTVSGSTQSIGATTDTSSGQFYVVVDTIANLIGVSANQIFASLNAKNAAAAFAGNGAVSTTSPSVLISGLSSGVTYGYAVAQAGSTNSNVLMGQFQTGTAAQTWRKLRGPGISPDLQQVFLARRLSNYVPPSLTGKGLALSTSSALAALTGKGSLAGLAASTGDAQGGISGSASVKGSASTNSPARGQLTGSGAIFGRAAGTSPTSGTLAGSGALSGRSNGNSPASASLTGTGALSARASSTGIAFSAVIGSGTLAGRADATSPAYAALGAMGEISGRASSSAPALGTLTAFSSGSITGRALGSSAAFAAILGVQTGAGRAFGTSAAYSAIAGEISAAGRASSSSPSKGTLGGMGNLSARAISGGAAYSAVHATGALAALARGSSAALGTLIGELKASGLAVTSSPAIGAISNLIVGSIQGVAACTGMALATISIYRIVEGGRETLSVIQAQDLLSILQASDSLNVMQAQDSFQVEQ